MAAVVFCGRLGIGSNVSEDEYAESVERTAGL